SASAAAWWLTGDSATIMPARKAPSAIDAPKSAYAPAAIAMENTMTVNVNNSRDRSRATWVRTHGTIFAPANITNTISATSLSNAIATAAQGEVHQASVTTSGSGAAPGFSPMIGIKTRKMTVNTSSTSSQPTATCPAGEVNTSASIRTRMSTTVLAT